MEQRFFADIEEGVLPFSAEAEQSVLGAIIIDPQSFILVEGLLFSLSVCFVSEFSSTL